MIVSKKYLTFMLLSMGIIASDSSYCLPIDTMLKVGAYGIIWYTFIFNAIPNDIKNAIINNTPIHCCTPYEYVSENYE